MAQAAAQMWKSSSFTIERHESEESGNIDFRVSGPFTARDMYGSISPEAFDSLFDSPPGGKEPRIHLVDLTEVPYMDSAGLGVLVPLCSLSGQGRTADCHRSQLARAGAFPHHAGWGASSAGLRGLNGGRRGSHLADP